MTIPHAVPTYQVVHALETDTDRLRAIQRPKHIRPLLPIEMEKTRLTPAISMSGIPESVRYAAVQMPTTPVRVQNSGSLVTGPLQDVHIPAPIKHPKKGSHEPGAHGTPPLFSVADVAECAEIMGPAGVNAVFHSLAFARAPMVISQMERRDRIVFLLLDGKRTLSDVARLIHRSELDVARILVRLWKLHFIER
jgi:hypothetical protein